MISALAFAPSFPLPVVAIVGALAAAVALTSAWRAPRSALPRVIALGALMGLLLNPQIRVSDREPLNDIAVILVDESGSQTLDDRTETAVAAAQAIESRLKELNGIEIVRTTISGDDETRIGEAVSRALSDNPRARLGGVFVVTDGQSSDEIPLDRLTDAPPIHFLMTGRRSETDRKVTLVDAPRYGIVNEGVIVGFRVEDLGPDEAPLSGRRTAIVTLTVDGEKALQQEVPVGVEVSFKAPLPRPGRAIIELEASPLPGEISARNNTAVLPISAIRDRLRVLLISGEPHAGERVWRNLLKSDPAIDLVHFTILRPIEKAASDSALEKELALIEFPQDELFIEKLHEFDLVIFDRYTYRGVLNAYHFDNIARYVENGGAVLVASGPEFNGYLSLAARRNFSFILPAMPAGAAIERPFRPKLSEEGNRHPVTKDLPEQDYWGRWLRIMPVLKRSGRTLMTGPDDTPLLILDRVGKGRVGLIQSDHVWLWARGFDGGGPHAELLRRIAHWLMKEPDLEEEQLRLIDADGDLVVDRHTIDDNAPPVTLTLPDKTTAELRLEPKAPGLFSGVLKRPPRGLYRARSGELFAIGEIGLSTTAEFENIVSDTSKLRPAAAATKGGVFQLRRDLGLAVPQLRRVNPRAAERSGADWAGIVQRSAVRTLAVSDAPIAPAWAWLLILVGSLAAAWRLEGRRKAKDTS